MSTVIVKPRVQVGLGGATFPCVGFSICAWPNRFAQATISITSDERDGGKFTKEEAIKICKTVQKRVLSGNYKGYVSANSGRGSISFRGTITGCNARSTASGGLVLTATLLSEDANLCKFNPSVLLSLTDEGIAKLHKEAKKKATELQINTTAQHPLAILTAEKGGSLSERIRDICKLAINYAKTYGLPKSKKSISGAISNFDYVNTFLSRSSKTSKLFNGEYTPSTPQENQMINAKIVEILFNSTNFWAAMLRMFSFFNMVYAVNANGLGRISNQEFDPKKQGVTIPGTLTRAVGVNSTTLGVAVLPASRVSMNINIDSGANDDKSIISASYPSTPDNSGGVECQLSPTLFISVVKGCIRANNISSGEIKKRSGLNATLSKVEKNSDRLLNKIIKAATALCKNYYYFLKYINSKASAQLYFSGTGNAYAGERVNVDGFKGVLSEIRVDGSSTEGVMCSASLTGVVL